MSERADRQRDERRRWAAAGSSHDRVIATSRLALPAAIGALVIFLALAPLTLGRDISFVLSKDRVDVAPERMRVAHAVYRGSDRKGQKFELTARSAVQQSSRDPIVRLQNLDARIAQAEGPATIHADLGRYDMNLDRIALDGPVLFTGAGGYRITTRDVLLDMDSRDIVGQHPVDGTMPLGHFAADHFRANLDSHVVDLIGRARLHMVQARSRGAR